MKLRSAWLLTALLIWQAGCSDRKITPAPEISTNSDAIPEVAAIDVAEADWPWWRGPNRNGIAADQSPPTHWSADENIVWKTSIPGRGHADPTVIGSRIVLPTADEKSERQSVGCYDRQTGRPLWQTVIHTGQFESNVHRKNSHASSTIACDGERLFAAFLNNRKIWVTALTLDGEQLWQTAAGPFDSQHGYGASPVLYKSFVIVAGDNQGGGFLAALHRETGKIIWRKSRPAQPSFASPTVAQVAGRDQLLICGCDLVASYDPDTGDALWSVDGTTKTTVGTMVAQNDLVFASGGYPGRETICIRADGSGEVIWRNSQKSYVPSLLLHEGYLYQVSDDGRAFCWDAETGQEQWKARLGGNYSASPVLAGGLVYVTSEAGETVVFRANPQKFELLARNGLGDSGFASPVICGDRIYLRTAERQSGERKEVLYCIGSNGSPSDGDGA